MALTPEKILTSSARDYAETVGIPLDAYDMVGVHLHLFPGGGRFEGVEKAFIERIPGEAEAVVDYRVSGGAGNRAVNLQSNIFCSGTALIPKEGTR
jgi:hypothetical protein